MMKPHLLEEEAIALPLLRAFFTPPEVGKLVQEILGNPKAPIEEKGSFIFWQTADKFRNKFMSQEGIPFFVWYIDFKAKYDNYCNEVNPQVDGLLKGVEPPPPAPAGSILPMIMGTLAASAIGFMYFRG